MIDGPILEALEYAVRSAILTSHATFDGTTLEAFQLALRTVAQPISIVLIIVGVLLGMTMGILPGMGGVLTMALLIPVTYGLSPLHAFLLLVAAKGGTNFGGSLTAILINTPGAAPNAATLLDGYPMTQQGRGAEAIGASAAASAFGALFGVIILIASIPVMRELALLMGPPEVFWLGIWGITAIAMVVKGNVVAGLISGALGLMFIMHGQSPWTGSFRWTYGFQFLWDGFKLIPALVGLFAVAEMFNLISKGQNIQPSSDISIEGDKWKGVRSVWTHRFLFLRSASIGTIIGAIPGVGGSAANFIAYFQAIQTSSDDENFGKGDIRGVIASESSNDAKDGGMFIPTLSLGVPGSATMAVLFGAFILHGVTPGPRVFTDHMDIVSIIIVALIISNILTSTIGITLAEYLVKLISIDIEYIAPTVILVAFLGAYALNQFILDTLQVFMFGLLGFMMIKINMSRIPMILAMVLGPIIERNYWNSLQISAGDYSIFVRGTITTVLFVLVLLTLAVPIVQERMGGQTS